jgi:hypothetical protein
MFKEMTVGRISLALPGLANLFAEGASAHSDGNASEAVFDCEIALLGRHA